MTSQPKFKIGDKVRVKSIDKVFVIEQMQVSYASTSTWYSVQEVEHYTPEVEVADIDKKIMELIVTKSKLVKEMIQGTQS